MVASAAELGISTFTSVLALITQLKKFIRADSWIKLAKMLQESSQRLGLSDEALKMSKKEIVDFTDSLERVLLYAFN